MIFHIKRLAGKLVSVVLALLFPACSPSLLDCAKGMEESIRGIGFIIDSNTIAYAKEKDCGIYVSVPAHLSNVVQSAIDKSIYSVDFNPVYVELTGNLSVKDSVVATVGGDRRVFDVKVIQKIDPDVDKKDAEIASELTLGYSEF